LERDLQKGGQKFAILLLRKRMTVALTLLPEKIFAKSSAERERRRD